MKYRFIFIISYLNLLWERFWNRFWLAVSIVILFAALGLLNLLLAQEPVWHLLMLAVFAIALAVALLLRTEHPFSFPSRDDVERRIEQASSLTHRPLQTLRDDPADGSAALWQQHWERAAHTLQQLKIYRPHSDVDRRDRWKLRYIALAFLVAGLAIAQREAGVRLYQAFTADFSPLIEKQIIALDLWITPPEYTHEATMFLATSKQGLVAHETPVSVPAGSILKLRLSGPHFTPRFAYAGKKHALTEVAPHNYTLDMPLQKSGTLSLGSWFYHLGQWKLTVLPDTPPQVNVSKIEATARGATKITYKASDDHGITKLTGIVATGNGKAYTFDIPPSNSANDTTYTEDLTAIPSAGEKASLWLEAQDDAGHKTDSAPASFILPERHFNSPLAQQIIAERKLLLTPNMTPDRHGVVQRLANIANNPMLYKGNILVFMSLNSAIKRLIYDNSDGALASVADLLWDVAIKIEDSGLSLAQRELSDALQKLSEALHDKSVTKEQLQDMLDDVKKKMQQYVQALAMAMQQKMQQGQKTPVLSPELAKKFMKNLDINKMLEQMRALNQANSREDLQKLADSLRNSLENFDMGKFNEMQQKQAQEMQELQNLQDIIHRQQSLFDKTNKTNDASDMPLLNKEQGGIRGKLGQSLRKLGMSGMEIPENFAKADQAMEASGKALGKGLAQESLPQQKTALDELQKGLDKAVKQMAQSMQQSLLSFGGLGESGNFGEGYDPLGRSTGMGTEDIKIPSDKERRRVQEIIEELRHRSNEPSRTKVERDYIDRLLDQF